MADGFANKTMIVFALGSRYNEFKNIYNNTDGPNAHLIALDSENGIAMNVKANLDFNAEQVKVPIDSSIPIPPTAKFYLGFGPHEDITHYIPATQQDIDTVYTRVIEFQSIQASK